MSLTLALDAQGFAPGGSVASMVVAAFFRLLMSRSASRKSYSLGVEFKCSRVV